MRVGVIGCGKIAQLKYLPYLAETPGVVIAGVTDESLHLASAAAVRFGAMSASTRIEDVLAQAPDAILVLNHDHAPVLRSLAGFEGAILAEKPLCWSADVAEELIRARPEGAPPLFPAFMRRYDPLVARLKQEIDERLAPRCIVINHFGGGSMPVCGLVDRKPPNDDRLAIKDRLLTSWGHRFDGVRPIVAQAVRLLLELLVHDLDLLIWLFNREIEIDDIIARSGGGEGALILRLSARTGGGSQIEIVCSPRFNAASPWRQSLEIVWENAAAGLRFGNPFRPVNEGTLTLDLGDRGDSVCIKPPPEDPFRLMLDAFLDSASRGSTEDGALKDALQGLRLIDRCEKHLIGASLDDL
jgi:predicted dehydrogenase